MSENLEKKRVVITILGMAGGNDSAKKASYYLENMELNTHFEYFNTFPFLCDTFGYNYDIVAVFTQSAKQNNHKVIEKTDFRKENSRQIALNSLQNGYEIDDTDYDKIFQKINEILNDEKYGEFIIDITHGFRHLPILTMVAMMIANFKNTQKIKHIFFAKEKEKNEIYEIVDLKEYLDIANISFILSEFGDNYTVSNHIKSPKFEDLLKALNDFSNDMMALNVGKLQISRNNLIEYLEEVDDEAIKQQAINLKIKIENLADFNAKRSEILYKLAKDMFDKNYLLLSLAALFESTRSYIVEFMYKNNNEIMQKIEDLYKNKSDRKNYLIDKFCKNTLKFFPKNKNNVYAEFLDRTSEKHEKLELTNKEIDRILSSLKKLENRNKIVSLYEKIETKRNDLAHANSSGKTFENIKNDIKTIFDKYESLITHN
ncbi:TM1812 family CRISPR-associated protein [Campylobacter sp. VBCF_05 NA6]|uniref:TM1812 family CRISPR-associated protein n=1 Tax=unclassified Campylobacter TaxID=2593542 RepID=UPI0022E9CD5F|nr:MULTISPECIES: TM1812 family CRISPR-associated protein [unclassified Campylobacter]MDA3057101.1 TM1812 family CRISPR-associated protein [Campylobacter sp. VBCF_04 NA7]MDA3059475.1 TM1812 family CRISPR-associated protein [Campylobacter sp. VBCF_05 NA6]